MDKFVVTQLTSLKNFHCCIAVVECFMCSVGGCQLLHWADC